MPKVDIKPLFPKFGSHKKLFLQVFTFKVSIIFLKPGVLIHP